MQVKTSLLCGKLEVKDFCSILRFRDSQSCIVSCRHLAYTYRIHHRIVRHEVHLFDKDPDQRYDFAYNQLAGN